MLTTGVAGRRPHKGWALGASVTSAVEGLTRALAVELAPLRVNAVSPGVVRTDLWKNMTEQERDAMYENVGKSLLVGRVGEPEEIASHLPLPDAGEATAPARSSWSTAVQRWSDVASIATAARARIDPVESRIGSGESWHTRFPHLTEDYNRSRPQHRFLPMAYQVLARKYRPQRFSDVAGQDHVTRTLMQRLNRTASPTATSSAGTAASAKRPSPESWPWR